jgi:pyridoxine 4-dehydrogenase
MPRFSGENLQRNLGLVEGLLAIARDKGISVAQLAIAWALARGESIVPLVGARTRERLKEALEALKVRLTAEDMARIEQAVPPGAAAGDRYDKHGMAMLDSEKKTA